MKINYLIRFNACMELLFDIGNTNTVVGVHLADSSFKIWRIGTNSFETEDELFALLYTLFQVSHIHPNNINSIGIASVVPSINYILNKLGEKYFHVPVRFLNANANVFDIAYHADYPQEIGADRIANVIAAKKEYGKHVIAIDFGSAITVDVIRDGDFVGGAILPGFKMSMLALFSNTAQLPQVELQIPEYSLGTNTIDNIQIGILKITILGIERLVEEIQRETATQYQVVCTGGVGKLLQGNSPLLQHYDPDLTLKGILYYLRYGTD